MRSLVGGIAALVAITATIPLLLISLPFFLVGGGARLVRRVLEWVQGRALPREALIKFEPEIGWRPLPNMHTWALDLVGNRFQLTTGDDGWRKSFLGEGDHDVVVFGDSFAFGFGVNDRSFFANLSSEPRIKAVGANGYNLVQELLLMRDQPDLLRGRLVIWFVYHGNDLLENLTANLRRHRMPFVRRGTHGEAWEIVTKHVTEAPWSIGIQRDYYGKLAEICCDTSLSKVAFSACDFLIGEGKALCDSLGARLVVLSLPDILQIDGSKIQFLADKAPDLSSFDVDRPDRELNRVCAKHMVECYTTKGVFGPEDFIRGDVHWNEYGHRKMACIVKDILKKSASTPGKH